jgi:hypothetical protein
MSTDIAALTANQIPDTAAMWRFLRLHLLPFTKKQLFVFVLVLWNSQLFTVTATNPLGIKYFQEVFYLILLAFSMTYLASQMLDSGKVRRTDLLVFLLVAFVLVYSPIAAWVKFKQPIWYGIIEERRVFAFWIYFPIVWALRNRVVTVHKLLNWIFISAFVCALLGIGVVADLVPRFQDIEHQYQVLREDRYGIGLWYISLATMVAFFRVSRNHWAFHMASILLFLGVLIVVGQTRQVLISLMIALLIMRGSLFLKIFLVPGLTLLLIGASLIPQIGESVDRYMELFTQLTTTQYLTEGGRAVTLITIFHELMKGAWFGSGSLSDLWRGGFEEMYRHYFHLVDVGAFGSLYKFGLFCIPFYLLYLGKQLQIARSISKHPYYRLILGAWAQVLVLMPVAAPIEHRGFMAGLLLAMSVGCVYELTASSQTSGDSRLSGGKFQPQTT